MRRHNDVDTKAEKKHKKPKQTRATLALVLAVITLVGSLFGSAIVSQEVSASEVRDVVTTEVEYRLQEVMASPPMQEIIQTESLDTDALTKEITDLVTADVLSKAMRQWQSLSTQDMDNLEQQLADIIAKSLQSSVSNLNSSDIVNRINDNLNISTNESLLEEEWLVSLITDTVVTVVEQTLVDVLTEEMAIIGQDLQLIQTYVDENLDTIYQLITDSQIDIVNMSNDISNLQELISNCVTKEELLELSTQLEMAITDLTVAQSNMQVQVSFLEQSLADRYDELLTLIEKNAQDIVDLQSKLNQTIAEMTAQINNLSNQINQQMTSNNEEINNKIDGELNIISQSIVENTDNLNEMIVGNYDDILERLRILEELSKQTIQGVKDDANTKIDENQHKTETNITYVDNKITQQVDYTDEKLTNQLNDTATNIYNDMNSMDNRLTNELNETATTIYNSMNDLDEQINISLDSLAYNVYNDVNALDQDIIDAFALFNSNAFKNFSTLHAYTKSVEDCLNYNVQNIERITNSNTQKTETWVEQLDTRQQTNLTKVATQLNSNINTMSTYIKNQVDSAIRTLNSNITNEIGAKFSAFATSTATAVNALGTSTENVFKSMGSVVKVKSFNTSTGVLYLESTAYPFVSGTTITKPSLTAPTINMATVTLGAMGALPTIEVRGGQVYINGSQSTSNVVNDPVLEQIQYQDTVQDPTVASFENSSKDASNPQYDDSVTNPEDRDYKHTDYVTDPKSHTDYEDGTYNTITWDDQGNINGEIETFGTN